MIQDKLNFIKSKIPEPIKNKIKYLLSKTITWLFIRRKRNSFEQSLLIKDPFKNKPTIGRLTSKIKFTSHIPPKASIIICVYNKLNFTLNCLFSIKTALTNISFEVVLIDDASEDNTKKYLPAIKGLRYYRNDSNIGFLHSSNKGAKKAKGKYLVFLNNDTVVCDHWLDNLIEHLESNMEVGLVGSKLLYPDGLLQEAGSYIFSDASGLNYGNRDNPHDFRYNYCRETDYCSGACIALKKNLFFDVGCFDELYSPCYYEDVDLAFKIRNKGYQIHYVYNSEIYHYEGISHGVDINSGHKKYQQINRDKFLNKWRSVLKSHTENNSYNPTTSWKLTHWNKKKLFFIDHKIPTPDQDAGSLRMFQLLKMLALKFHVTFYPLFEFDESPLYSEKLKHLGIECINGIGSIGIEQFLELNGKEYDYFICSKTELAEYFLYYKDFFPNAYSIFDTVDLSHVRISRQAELSDDHREKTHLKDLSDKYYKMTKIAVERSNETWVVTESEKNKILEIKPDTIINIIPTIHPIPNIENKKYDCTEDIFFIGGFEHLPNVDAVMFFISNIWPYIVNEIVNIRFVIIGSKIPIEIKRLETDRIIVKGFVENLEPDLLKARLFSAPLRYGAGMKGKIGQSLSYGIPTVTTTIGAEGFDCKENGIIIADDPKEHANSIIKLYKDEITWNRYHKNGHKFMKNFSPEAVQKKLFEVFE